MLFLLTMPCGFTEFDDLDYLLQMFFPGFCEIHVFCASGASPAAMPQVIWVYVDSMLPVERMNGFKSGF